MNKTLINILLFCAFSIPLPFLAMYQDKFYGIVIGYAIMLAALYTLSAFGRLLSEFSLVLMLTGNIMSSIISWYCLSIMLTEKGDTWLHYFKPFTPMQCLMIICVVNLIPQFHARYLMKWYQNRNKELSNQTEPAA
ncbi:hypothetical protein [Bacillus bombysepticus]|uniref:hypothetical protein n=1 Tax=Bacillus bombysepticus TaxID=658666 RepID=UPI003015E834